MNHPIQLTSAEIGNFWVAYMGDTASVCELSYALAVVEDSEIRTVIKYALELSQKHLAAVAAFFQNEHHPVPIGFTSSDVDLTAPRLYGDAYFLVFVQSMAELKINAFAMALTHSSRPDVRAFFTECLASSCKIDRGSCPLCGGRGKHYH